MGANIKCANWHSAPPGGLKVLTLCIQWSRRDYVTGGLVPGPGGFYLPKNETEPDPMHFDIDVI